MSQKTGKQIVYLYGKNIPKSGKSVFEFGGIKMCHRSIGADKSDLLVHIDTAAIIRSYPAKTDRSVVLDDMAQNLKILNHFIAHRESYSVEERPKPEKKKDNDADVTYAMFKEPSYSRSGKFNHLNKDAVVKKKYDIRKSKW